MVFPEYYVAGTINVSYLPGTIAYSPHLQSEMLEETTSEKGRNGCKKILIVNSHTGNNGLIAQIVSSGFDKPRSYVIYAMQGSPPRMSPPNQGLKLPAAMRPSKPGVDGHGGEERISVLLAYRPDLVHVDRAHEESDSAQTVLPLPAGVQVGVDGMAELPTSYQGDASDATAARGKAIANWISEQIVEGIRAIKKDEVSPRLQRELIEQAQQPTR